VFLTSRDELRSGQFDIPGNQILHNLLLVLKSTVAARHWLPPLTENEVANLALSGNRAPDLAQEKSDFERRLKLLENHEGMRKIFEKFLAEQWPTDDVAIIQQITASRSTVAVSKASSKRSRSMAERNGISLEPSSSKRRG
jgi:hypothetical protein